jgi:Flp pilus assembly protein TadG
MDGAVTERGELVEMRRRRAMSAAARGLMLRREDGQAMLEFALVLLPLCLILFGAVEFGRAWNNKNDVVHIANEAARYAAVNQLTNANCTKLKTEATGDIPNLQPADVTISTPTAPAGNGTPVTIDVSVPFHSFVPLIASILNISSLKGSATMQFEGSAYSGTCY